jgi:phenylalanyl-tRNA synthetase beta chain
MQFSESWLRQFVNPQITTDALEHLMTMAGLEVEEMKQLAPPFHSVVVAEILEATQHPDADRLRVCKVSVGALSLEPLQIVCGAPNARVGIKIPCAMVGAELPPSEDGKSFKIKIGKLRGVESYGMLCSGREIGLGEDHAGIYELPLDAPVGTNIREYLGLDDTIFTIKLTPNKADCLSVFGIAREVSALTGSPLLERPNFKVKETIKDFLKVHVMDKALCGRFAGRIVKGVNAKAVTPPWMVQRLASSGQRSISALVDISNYVMLEMGQPTHIFDAEKINGDLQVRFAKPGEKVLLLNGQEVQLGDVSLPVGVIADDHGIESIAGIMGGDHSAVTLETQNIYIESAFWWPSAIQGRARQLKFSTDAAFRFERGVDPDRTVKYLDYVTQLVHEICGGEIGPLDDQIFELPKIHQITLRVPRVEKILGIPMDGNQISEYFDGLDFSYARMHPGTPQEVFVVETPRYRFDLQIEEDLIEEIARLYGFENIPELAPQASIRVKPTNETRRSMHALRHTIAAQDYQEVVNYGFIDQESETIINNNTQPIQVLNPLAEQFAVMRSTLLGGLVHNLKTNLNRKATRVRIFEIGRVFMRNQHIHDGPLSVTGMEQPMRIGGLAYGDVESEQWGSTSRRIDFFDVKADLEAILQPLTIMTQAAEHPAFHPGRSAKVFKQDTVGDRVEIGYIGELHPKLQQHYGFTFAPVLFEIDLEKVLAIDLPKLVEPSKFPSVERDLAIVLQANVPAQQVLDALRQAASGLVTHIALFDEFRTTPERLSGMQLDEKSLAFRVTLSDDTQTLQDTDVENAIKQLLSQVLIQFSARLR